MTQELDKKVLHLVKQKEFYPFEYRSDKEKVARKENFYSSLTRGKVTDKEYECVLNVWNKFETKAMKDYHDFYLKYDLSLLADVFEKLRNNSLRNYGLFPSHYLSAPGFGM